MRSFLLSSFFILWSIATGQASAIKVDYTGTYVASWAGNYDPQTGITPPGGYGEGSLGSGPFRASFYFDTAHPRAIVTSTRLDTTDPACGCNTFPEPGPGWSDWGEQWSYATHTISGHNIRSSLSYFSSLAGAYGISVTFSIEGNSESLPADIFTPVTIGDFNGTGRFQYNYGARGEGGGYVTYDISVTGLKILIDGVGEPTAAVPEPSTWAMLLIGFGGIGYLAHRRRKIGTLTA